MPLVVLVGLALSPAGASTQSFQAGLSSDTVPMGEVFELRVRVPVPAGSVVYFPDTVATTAVLESHRTAAWQAEEAAGGGATLTLTYPVIAWGAGLVPVPGFDVYVAPLEASPPGGAPALPGGSYVGAWRDAPVRGAAYVAPLRVPRRGVWVRPVFDEAQMEVGVEPMPSADVLGSSWHWPSIALGLIFAAALAALALREGRRAMSGARRHGPVPWTPAAARRDALDQLDALLAEALPASGRTQELYFRSSAIVRSLVARLHADLGAHLTSSEVLARLGGRRGGGPNGRDATLVREMRTAEVVKFGRARPPRDEAEAHLHSLRDWVETTGDAP